MPPRRSQNTPHALDDENAGNVTKRPRMEVMGANTDRGAQIAPPPENVDKISQPKVIKAGTRTVSKTRKQLKSGRDMLNYMKELRCARSAPPLKWPEPDRVNSEGSEYYSQNRKYKTYYSQNPEYINEGINHGTKNQPYQGENNLTLKLDSNDLMQLTHQRESKILRPYKAKSASQGHLLLSLFDKRSKVEDPAHISTEEGKPVLQQETKPVFRSIPKLVQLKLVLKK